MDETEIEAQSYKLILTSLCEHLAKIAAHLSSMSDSLETISDKLEAVSDTANRDEFNEFSFIRISDVGN